MRYFRRENFGVIYIPPHQPGMVLKEEALPLIEAGVTDIDHLALKHMVVQDQPFRLSAPIMTFIELTRACNLSCVHCYLDAGHALKPELTTSEILHLMDELDDMEVFSVLLSGGEPLLRQDFKIIAQHTERLNFHVGLITNGTLLTAEILEQIPGHMALAISVDGKASQQRIRKGSTFADMERVFNLLKEQKRHFTCLTTFTTDNIDDADALFGFLIGHKIPFTSFNCNPLGRADRNRNLLPGLEHVFQAVKLEMIQHVGMSLVSAFIAKDRANYSSFDNFFDLANRLEEATGMCKGGRSFAYIQADGLVFPCTNCAAAGMYGADSVKHSKFRTIWDRSFKRIREIEWRHFSACPNCELQQRNVGCTYRCPALSNSLHKNPNVCGATPFTRAFMDVLDHIHGMTADSEKHYQELLSEVLARGEDSLIGRLVTESCQRHQRIIPG